jgi:hypothetical protein
MDWQPIETAPKDGTPILGFMPSDDFSPITGIEVIWWDFGAWLMGCEAVIDHPTHWMPLPDPPK